MKKPEPKKKSQSEPPKHGANCMCLYCRSQRRARGFDTYGR